METAALVLLSIIAGLAWHRRRLQCEVIELRRQVRVLQASHTGYRLYFAPYDTLEAKESWSGHSIPPGEHAASRSPYNVFGQGYLN